MTFPMIILTLSFWMVTSWAYIISIIGIIKYYCNKNKMYPNGIKDSFVYKLIKYTW